MSHTVEFRQQNIIRGVSMIVAVALLISIQDVIFKLFSSELTLWQIFSLRGALAVPLLLIISWMCGTHKGILRTAFGKWPLVRGLFITITFLAFYAAIPFLSLSIVGAANYIAPIFVALLSAYVIKEAVGPLGWLGVLLGFSGVVVLLQPGTDAFSAWTLLPIIGAAFYALAHTTTRVKCQGIPLAALSLAQNTILLLAGLFVSLLLIWLKPQEDLAETYPYIFDMWSAVDLTDWLTLILLAGFTIVIGMILAGAYQAAPPSIVSTFEYSYLIFAVAWDILFFGITPTLTSALGMVMIVAAGLLVLGRKVN